EGGKKEPEEGEDFCFRKELLVWSRGRTPGTEQITHQDDNKYQGNDQNGNSKLGADLRGVVMEMPMVCRNGFPRCKIGFIELVHPAWTYARNRMIENHSPSDLEHLQAFGVGVVAEIHCIRYAGAHGFRSDAIQNNRNQWHRPYPPRASPDQVND